jgi:hypothetical protein
MEEEWAQKETKVTKSGDQCTASAAEDAGDAAAKERKERTV